MTNLNGSESSLINLKTWWFYLMPDGDMTDEWVDSALTKADSGDYIEGPYEILPMTKADVQKMTAEGLEDQSKA